MWPFIWKGKIEPVSRDRCCGPILSGSLNIVNFSVKCISLRLSCFASLRDRFGTEKWHYLARYFLGNRLAKFDRRFNFSSNSFPSSLVPSRFYQLCLHKFSFLFSTYGCLPDCLTCKNIYKLLMTLPSSAPKCAGFWGSVVGRPINRWASVWRKSRLKLNENKKNDLLWLILHRAVKVRYALKTWGYIDNDRCSLCSGVETIEHCFLECQRVVHVWGHFAPILSRFWSRSFSVSVASVFYPFSDSISSSSTSIYNFLVVTILFWIWKARNLSTFRNSRLSSQRIIDLVIRDVKLHISCASLDTAKYFWSKDSILCSVVDDAIQFSL